MKKCVQHLTKHVNFHSKHKHMGCGTEIQKWVVHSLVYPWVWATFKDEREVDWVTWGRRSGGNIRFNCRERQNMSHGRRVCVWESVCAQELLSVCLQSAFFPPDKPSWKLIREVKQALTTPSCQMQAARAQRIDPTVKSCSETKRTTTQAHPMSEGSSLVQVLADGDTDPLLALLCGPACSLTGWRRLPLWRSIKAQQLYHTAPSNLVRHVQWRNGSAQIMLFFNYILLKNVLGTLPNQVTFIYLLMVAHTTTRATHGQFAVCYIWGRAAQ